MPIATGGGLHHVTAIATDASRNLDFYAHILGLRLEKRTVTHEDPGAYHLIYGQGDGRPGGHLTFFSWSSSAASGRPADEMEFLLFAVSPGALDWWEERLSRYGISSRRALLPFGRDALLFEDPDHTRLALVTALTPGPARTTRDIPAEFAIHGLLGVALSVKATELMSCVLIEALGFAETRREGDWAEFVAHGEAGGTVLLHRRQGQPRARLGAGAIHHVAFRVKDEAQQVATARILKDRLGIEASPVKDRYYFRSIYFRGPDGILIEISTDGPGLLIDEAPEELGTRLILPPGLADRQEELLRILPPLD